MQNNYKIEGHGPFKVPEGYFDEVNRKILAATSEKKRSKKFALQVDLRSLFAAAAAIGVLVVIGFLAGNMLREKEVLPELSEIVVSDPELYADDLDITFVENNFEFIDFSNESGLNNNEIIEYLLAEDLDELLIFEKL